MKQSLYIKQEFWIAKYFTAVYAKSWGLILAKLSDNSTIFKDSSLRGREWGKGGKSQTSEIPNMSVKATKTFQEKKFKFIILIDLVIHSKTFQAYANHNIIWVIRNFIQLLEWCVSCQPSRHKGLKLCFTVNIPVHTFSTVYTSNSGRACTVERIVTGITTVATIQARIRFTYGGGWKGQEKVGLITKLKLLNIMPLLITLRIINLMIQTKSYICQIGSILGFKRNWLAMTFSLEILCSNSPIASK